MVKAIITVYDRDENGNVQHIGDKPLIKEIAMNYPIIFQRVEGEMPHIKGFIPKIFITEIIGVDYKELVRGEFCVFVSLTNRRPVVVKHTGPNYRRYLNNVSYYLHYEGSLDNCINESELLISQLSKKNELTIIHS